MRLDYLTIFPDYLAPLRQSLPGKAADKGLIELHVHDLRTWTHDRHHTVDDTPVRRGSGMVMQPEPWGEAFDELGDRRRHPGRADAVRGRRSTRRWPASWPAASGWSSPAGATRASTSACSTTPRPGPRWSRCRSATTCSTAARSPRWRSPRPWSGCCPASWATRSHWSRSPTRAACWSTPSTPGRPSWRGLDVPPVLLSGDHGAVAAWRLDAGPPSYGGAAPGPAAPEPGRRRLADRAGDAGRRGELFTLQRACWVQEALANDAWRTSPPCTSRSRTCAPG